MSEDLSDLINNVKSMIDSGNIPDNMKEILNNINTTNSDSNSDNISNSNETSSSSGSSNPNISNFDIDTILKIKKVMDSINQNNDPRANLLYSLKPYLRESRKSKLDQYVNLLNMTKIVDLINNEKKENNGNV